MMTEQIKLIAERLKGFREITGISSETLAKELGIINSLYLSYESGQIDIPVGVLIKAAQRFDIDLSVLLSGENPRLRKFSIVRKGHGLKVDRRKQYKYESLAYNFIDKKAEPFLVTVEPITDDTSIEYNSHPGQEFNHVLEGSMSLFIDEHEIILNEGDSIFFDSGCKHAMKTRNDLPVKFLAIIL